MATKRASVKKTPAKKMTKAELVRLLAEKTDLTTKQSAALFKLLASAAVQETKKKRRVHHSRAWQVGQNAEGSSDGSEPCDRRNDQDQSEDDR